MSFELTQINIVVQEQANSQENMGEILFSRLSNFTIRKQIIDLLYKSEMYTKTTQIPIKSHNFAP